MSLECFHLPFHCTKSLYQLFPKVIAKIITKIITKVIARVIAKVITKMSAKIIAKIIAKVIAKVIAKMKAKVIAKVITKLITMIKLSLHSGILPYKNQWIFSDIKIIHPEISPIRSRFVLDSFLICCRFVGDCL
jgi:hypothetical protein